MQAVSKGLYCSAKADGLSECGEFGDFSFIILISSVGLKEVAVLGVGIPTPLLFVQHKGAGQPMLVEFLEIENRTMNHYRGVP